MTRCRVDYQAHRLVYYDDVGVLIDDIQGNILGGGFHRFRIREENSKDIPGAGFVIFFHRETI